jgi:hypothetical protein
LGRYSRELSPLAESAEATGCSDKLEPIEKEAGKDSVSYGGLENKQSMKIWAGRACEE